MNKEIMSVTICGRKFKHNEYQRDIYATFVNTFSTKLQVVNWYNKVLKSEGVIKTNFGGNPFENHSFIVFKKNEETFVINSPIAKNGDNNWYSYGESFGFFVEMKLVED